jgi:hypothetical protein
MTESGGRRIKRAMYIDTGSIKFCTDEMLAHLKKWFFSKICGYPSGPESVLVENILP